MIRGSTRLTRRHALATLVGTAVAAVLAACQSAPVSPTAAPTQPPKPAATNAPASAPTAAPSVALTTAPAAAAPAGQRKQVSIDFWNWWDVERKPLMDKILAGLMKEQPWISVKNDVQTWDHRAERVATALASGKPPQVIMATTQEVVKFIDSGLIVPITKYVKQDNLDVEKIFYPSEIANFWWKGELYTMPMPTAGGETDLIFTSDDLLSKAGLDPNKPPENWADFEEYSKKLTKKNPMGAIETLGGDVGSTSTDFISWLYTNDGTFLSDDLRQLKFNSPEGVATLDWMVKFTKSVNGGIEAVTDFWTSARGGTGQDPFAQNRVGILMQNVSEFYHIKSLAPNLKYGLALRPFNQGNSKATHHGVANLNFGWGYPIPKGLDADTEYGAYLVAKQVTATEDACNFMFAQLRPSPIRACNEDPRYKQVNPHWDVVVKSLELDIPMKMTPVQAELYKFVNQGVQDAMYGRKSAAQALNDAEAQAQKVLDDYWSKKK